MFRRKCFRSLLVLTLFCHPAWSEDEGPKADRCEDFLTRSKRPAEDFNLSDPIIEESFYFYSDQAAQLMRAKLYRVQDNNDSREAFRVWVLEFLNPRDLLFEVGLVSGEGDLREKVGYSEDPAQELALESVDELLDAISLIYLKYVNLIAAGYEDFPQLTMEDGHVHNRFESWAIAITDLYDEAREKHAEVTSLFYQNHDISLALQQRVDNIVRYTAALVGARQEVFEFLLRAEVPSELRVILESSILPSIGRRLSQLHEAFEDRNTTYLDITERVLNQKDRLMVLDGMLTRMDH